MADDPIARLLADPPDLPVAAGLAELIEAVRADGVAVLHSPPGTGKTTLVPPALAAVVAGRVVVTQPRRLAARAAAGRLAHLFGEPVGRTVGYSVRGESRTSADTRIEMVTTGVLLRRLQRDPELPGVHAVVLDECHERHLDADLALALLVDVRTHLRDLTVVAMSATVEAERTAGLLGGERAARVVAVEGALHPVATLWCPPSRHAPPVDQRGVTPAFLDHVAATTRRALTECAGDVLVFLPGAGEVSGVARRLAGVDADVRPLHGRLSHREQDLALTEGPRRRVVVSTAVAESSLTVPGVRVVVDAGLARESRADHRRGLAGLVTVRVSQAGATQRAGRAGREAPGAVYRCWSESDHVRLPRHPEPEIATADLTAFALDLACWGSPTGDGLALMDPPPAAAMAVARDTLVGLGAVASDGRATARGRAIAAIAADPRLARALLDGAPAVGTRRAAEVVALLSEDVRAPGGDLVAALRSLRRGGPDATSWLAQVRRLQASLPGAAARPGRRDPGPIDPSHGDLTDDLAVGLVVALAHPDRIARRRPGGSAYVMASGTGAVLPVENGALAGLPWLAVADADRSPGRSDALVRSAAPLDEDLAVRAAPSLLRLEERVEWSAGQVVAQRTTWLGAIDLSTTTIPDPPVALVTRAVRDGLDREGLALLHWSTAAESLRHRMDFLHRAMGPPWPDVSDDALRGDLDGWLGPDLVRVRGARDLARIDVLTAVRRLLPWPDAGRLDALAPERVTVPSGTSVRIDYGNDQPVLAVRVQEVFGWRATPRLADGRVPVLLHLLSPARRPAAVTADLASFWRTGYPQVRAELRGRYPKHSWPDDPLTAAPTRGTRDRAGGRAQG
ncbi:ATP-dependent helicase HrpB [Cellulomonas sp. KRMCY2]|uniref:ATP-dependent helicase HrpB n=1 Tax=Cellulomonas sp. KRMCY2 TaxID=1304865 RepID=UPI0004AFFE0B|nr:ATP-dependent helicase HrpB [Cellulomonas sp. KRMCY2]